MLGGIEMDPHRLRAALAVAVVVVLTAAIPASATPTAPNGNPIAFTDTWRGVVDFDNIAPTIKVRRATATRLGKGRSYVLRLSFACPDNVAGNNVSYTVLIGTAASDLAKRAGKTTAAASLSLRVRPPRSARFVSVDITATDPVGNLRTTARRVALGRRRS